MNDTRHVKGLRELDRLLQTLPAKMERNVLRGGLRAGAKPVQEEAKANAPKDTGQLAAGIRISTSAKGGQVMAKVKLTGPHAFLGPWMEYGTAAHRITAKEGGWLTVDGGFFRSVDHPGMQPRPFLRPALDSQAQAAVVAAAEYMKRRLSTKHGLDTADVEIEAVNG